MDSGLQMSAIVSVGVTAIVLAAMALTTSTHGAWLAATTSDGRSVIAVGLAALIWAFVRARPPSAAARVQWLRL